MRLRRRHRDWSLPSGLAEVALFQFWEADLAGPPAAGPMDATVLPTCPPPTGAAAPQPREVPSAVPLWWAAGLVLLVVVLAILM